MSRVLIGNVRDPLINNLTTTTVGAGALDAAQGKTLKDLIDQQAEQQADEFNASKTYAVGEYCIHDNVLYKCNTAITSAGAWDSAKWTETTIAAEVKDNADAIASLNANSKKFTKILGTSTTITTGNSIEVNYDNTKAYESFEIMYYGYNGYRMSQEVPISLVSIPFLTNKTNFDHFSVSFANGKMKIENLSMTTSVVITSIALIS